MRCHFAKFISKERWQSGNIYYSKRSYPSAYKVSQARHNNFMAKFGGRQPGAGRPKGSTTKPRISDFLSDERIKELVDRAINLADLGDSTMLKFILDQYFGRAPQAVDVTSGNEPIPLLNALREDNQTH